MRRGKDTGLVATTMVAAARAVATRSGLLHDPFAAPLVRATGIEFFVRALDDLSASQPGDNTRFTQMAELFAVRTRFFDDFFADAGIAGIRQMVILGSGLDARPYRLWWPAGTTVYEIDRPHVIEFKNRALRRLGATPTAHRRAVGIDLRQDWQVALRRVGFDATQPSAWVAEGLLMGVVQHQDRLLGDITALSTPGSRFTADYVPAGSLSQMRREPAIADRLRDHGVNVDSAELPDLTEYDAAGYLAAHGWQTDEATLDRLFAAAGVRRPGRPDGLDDMPGFVRYLTATRVQPASGV